MASEIKVDTISEKTSANGVTIDGVSLKDSKIATANSVDSDAYVDGSIDAAHIASDAVTTAKILDDNVTAAKMADNSVDSDSYVDASIDNAHLADNAVDTAEIADNAVTLAKMAGLARGTLVYGDASGDPAALAVGGADEVLTHDGTDLSWAAASGGDVAGIGFSALMSADLTTTHNTVQKIPFDVEHIDIGTCYDTANNRFTMSPAGKYLIGYKISQADEGNTDELFSGYIYPYLNGSLFAIQGSQAEFTCYVKHAACTSSIMQQGTFFYDASDNDYMELWMNFGHKDGAGNNGVISRIYSNWWGMRIT